MSKKRTYVPLMKADEDFLKDIKEMQLGRIKNGKDKRLTPSRRITLAIKRHPLFPQIKNDILRADLPDLKKEIRRIF